MAEAPIRLLVSNGTPDDVIARAKALSPRIEVIRGDEVKADPALFGTVEIIYGSMRPDQWTQASSLKWLQTTYAGVNRLLTPEAKAHPAVVTNARIHGEPIAEHLFGMLLMFSRGLLFACRQQGSHTWDSAGFRAHVVTLPGKTLGILGLGAIGGRAAELGQAFGMRVLGLRRREGPAPHVDEVFTPARKREMLAQCDFVMNTLPLTEETRHILGAGEFAAMKPGALVFNIGRGETMDTDAMMAALRSGQLGGAGLDVTDPEPLPREHPLWDIPTVFISPHYAGTHPDYQQNAARVFLDNLRRYLSGQPLESMVDKHAGY